MRSALPFILVLLAVLTAGCIAYIAWELSSDKGDEGPAAADQESENDE
jgi:threonine/homoserine/homoserine lactone efflux protein